MLGTPTKDELKSMNPNYQEFKFPQIRAYPWGSIFKPSTPPESIDLIGKLLAYVPDKRLKSIEVSGGDGCLVLVVSCVRSVVWSFVCLGCSLVFIVSVCWSDLLLLLFPPFSSFQACEHPFFDELRLPTTTMPDGSPLQPELFVFTSEELTLSPR